MPASKAQKLAKKVNRVHKREIAVASREQHTQFAVANVRSFEDLDDLTTLLEQRKQQAIARVIDGISLGMSFRDRN